MERNVLRGLVLAGWVIAGCGSSNGVSSDGGAPVDLAAAADASAQANDLSAVTDAARSTDGGSGPVACAGYRYCENFEGYAGPVANGATLGPWKATLNGGGAMAVDSVRPYSGSRALHVTTPIGAPARGTLNQMAAKGLVPGNNLFGRAMVYYSAAPSGNADMGSYGLPLAVHSWIFSSSGPVAADAGTVNMNLGGGGAKLQLNYHFPPAMGGEQSVQGGMITTDQWHCVQWQYDGPKNQASVWLDGALVVSVPAAKGWTFPAPWETFDFGFNHYQTLTNPVDIYLDDFALNETMVPCP